MNLKTDIIIDQESEFFYKCFKPEVKEWNRSKIITTKNKKNLKFTIHAQDPIALKATLNSVKGLLKVHKKITKLIEKNG